MPLDIEYVHLFPSFSGRYSADKTDEHDNKAAIIAVAILDMSLSLMFVEFIDDSSLLTQNVFLIISFLNRKKHSSRLFLIT